MDWVLQWIQLSGLLGIMWVSSSPIHVKSRHFVGEETVTNHLEIIFKVHCLVNQTDRLSTTEVVYMNSKIGARPPKDLTRLTKTLSSIRNLYSVFTCEVCKTLVLLLQILFEQGKSHEEIIDSLTYVCIKFGIEDVRVCEAVTKEFENEVLTVFADVALRPDEICGLVFGDGCAKVYNPLGNWTVLLPAVPKPPVIPHKLPKPGSPTLRVLHLSDIHYDPLYKEGSNAACSEPLCCRKHDGPTDIPGSKAGKWGDYRNCDIPTVTLENLFIHLNKTRDQFDFVLWTGDLPAHDIWNQTRDQQIKLINYITELFVKYLPNTPIFPSLGNHESAPCNSFPPPFITGENSIDWLYTALSDSWGTWLPPQTKNTIKYGAYYTVSPFPGFRIISVNSNYCNAFNWWLLLNTTDPAGELNWLINVLQAAEKYEEKVHIISHIPPGRSDCLEAWSWNYYKIINRYESTIVGQFYGHTHKDHFAMFYDETDMKRPLGVGYIVGSVTSYTDLNPGYRIYEIDGNYKNSSWAVLDHTNYILNLTHANRNPSVPAQWQLEYSVKAAYGMKSLFPEDWNHLIDRLQKDQSAFDLFYKYYKKSNVKEGECDEKCRRGIICGLRNGRSHDTSLCSD